MANSNGGSASRFWRLISSGCPNHHIAGSLSKTPALCDSKTGGTCSARCEKTKPVKGASGSATYRSTEWSDASKTDWSVLELTPGYHGAPQIFWFSPHRKWYLIYQSEDSTRGLKYGPCFSTNERIDDPAAWTLPEPLFEFAEGEKAGLDYWIICDEGRAHLFYTTLDGRMWRSSTSLNMFPDRGWTKPVVASQADIFEASHIYRLGANGSFLTVVEAQGNRRRYFKSFVAETLDGKMETSRKLSKDTLRFARQRRQSR